MNRPDLHTLAAAIMHAPASVHTRVAVVRRLYLLGEVIGTDGREPVAAFAWTLRQCEAIAARNGDSAFSATLKTARTEAAALAFSELGIVA